MVFQKKTFSPTRLKLDVADIWFQVGFCGSESDLWMDLRRRKRLGGKKGWKTVNCFSNWVTRCPIWDQMFEMSDLKTDVWDVQFRQIGCLRCQISKKGEEIYIRARQSPEPVVRLLWRAAARERRSAKRHRHRWQLIRQYLAGTVHTHTIICSGFLNCRPMIVLVKTDKCTYIKHAYI